MRIHSSDGPMGSLLPKNLRTHDASQIGLRRFGGEQHRSHLVKSCAVVMGAQQKTARHEHQSPVHSQRPDEKALGAAPVGTTSPLTTVASGLDISC